MTIKAEGSTKFTFEIVASGADEARAKVEALQKALDNLKASTKTSINLDVKLSSGAQTLLKTNKNLLTTALKAGGNLGTALKDGLEKSLSTDDKKNKNVIADTLLKENKESATAAVDDYIKEKEKVQSGDQEKISKQLTWAKDQTQKIQKEYDKFAEIKKKYDNGDDALKAELQEEVNTKARDLLGTIGNTFEERGTKIWEQLSEEKGQLLKIKEDLFGHLNETYYKSSNYKGQNLSEIPTSELLWEEDKKAVEKAKQRLVEQREVGSEIIAAENDQLFTRAEAVDKQITQAKAIQKKISKAESSEEIKGLMSSLNGINWTPETEETVKAKNKSKRSANLLTQETDKATKAIDNFILESQSALNANKQKVEAEEKWAKSRLDDFKSVLKEAGITQEKLAFTKDGRLEESFTEAESATLKDVIAQIDSLTSDDGKSEFDRVKAVKKEARTLRDDLVRAVNYDEGDEVQGQDVYGQLLGDSIRDEVKTLTEKYRKENTSNPDRVKPSISESILSEAEEARLSSQVSLAQKAKANLSQSKTVKEAKQAIQSLQQGMVETHELSSGSLNELADIYANDYDSLVATFNENKNDTQAFVKRMNEYSNMKLEDQKFKGKNNFDSARNILKNFENLPTSQYKEFGNLLKDLDLYSLPDGSENFSGEKVFRTVKDGLSNALETYSKLSQEDISKYITENAEEFLANQREFNKQPVDSKTQYSSVNALNNSLNKVTKSLDSINNAEVKVDSVETAQTKIDSLGSENKTISIEVDPPLATVIAQLNELKAGLESLPKKINIPLTLDSKKAESSLKNINQELQSNPKLVTDTASETKTTTKTKGTGKATETTTTTTTETTKKATNQLTSNSTLEEVTSKLSDFKGKVTFETNLEELQSKVTDLKGKINFTSNLDDLLSKVESVIGRSILGNPNGKSGDTVLQEMVAQKTFLQESSEQFAEASKNFDTSLFASNPKQATEVTNKAKEFLARLKSYSKDEMAALNDVFPELAENWETQAQEATKIVNQSKITKNNTKKSRRISKKKAKSLEEEYENASSEKLMDRALESEIERKSDVAKEMRAQITSAKQVQQEVTQGEKLNTVVNNLEDKSKDIAINIEVSGIDQAKSSLESLNTALDSLKTKANDPIKIDVSLSEEAKTALKAQETLAKESASKAKETPVTSDTSKLVQGLTKQAEPTEQVVNQEVETLKNNIQTKIHKALGSYGSGDMNAFYQAMSEPLIDGAKPIGDYLLDAYTQIGTIKNNDLSSIISNLSVSDSDQLKNVSQQQLNQVRSVLKDMATAYSTAYKDGLENVDLTTQQAIQSYQPKFNERYNQIFPSKEVTSNASKSATEVTKDIQTVKETESVLDSIQNKATELNLKLNIEPSAEQVTSQIESLKSTLDSLKAEDVKIRLSTNIEEILSQVESAKLKILGTTKTDTTSKDKSQLTTQAKTASEESTQVKEVKTAKEVKVPVTGEVTNLETPKEQTVKVKAVTEPTSDENKIAEKVLATQSKVEFTSNIEDLQARLSSMRGHVEFDSNISELQAQLNMVSKSSSGSKSTSSSGTSLSNSKTIESEKIVTISKPSKSDDLSVPLSSTTALAKLYQLPKAIDVVQSVKSIKPLTLPDVIELPTAAITTALAQLKESPKALNTDQFIRSLKVSEVQAQTQSLIKGTVTPALGLVEEAFKSAGQTASSITAASIQDSFKALDGSNFSRFDNFSKTQAQLNNLSNLLSISNILSPKTNPNLLKGEILQGIKLDSSISGVPTYVESRSKTFSNNQGQSFTYSSSLKDTSISKDISNLAASSFETVQKSMLNEISTRFNSSSFIPAKEYAKVFDESAKQLDNLNASYRQLGYTPNGQEIQKAQANIYDAFTKNLQVLDKPNKMTRGSQQIGSISEVEARVRYGYDPSKELSSTWKTSMEQLLTATFKKNGQEIEKLMVSNTKDGKYPAKYLVGENEESSTFSLKPYTDISGQKAYAIQKSSSTVRPTNRVSSKYIEDLNTRASERFKQLEEHYGNEDKFFQSQGLKKVLASRDDSLNEVLKFAAQPEVTQKQVEARLNRAVKEREKDFQTVTKDLSKEGYLGERNDQFLSELSRVNGQQRKRFLEDTFKSLYEEKGQSAKNLKVLSESGDDYTIQREVDGKKVTSKIKATSHQRDDEGIQTVFRESQSSGEFQAGSLKSWGSGIAQKFKSMGQYLAGMYMAQKVMSEISSGVSFIQETDKAMSNINMTMKATPEEITKLRKDSIQAGIDLKTSASNVIEATTIYANAGENSQSILAKAKPTILLANASGQSASTAADQIQAVQNQFDGLEDDTERIVNSYESISAGIKMDFAEGIGSIADGVKNAGSIADEAGLGFEQFASIIAKVAEVTREEGSAIGNTLKTTMARISRSKTADTEVTGKDRSLAAEAYQEVLGIDLFDKNGNYADLSETLDLLASRWSSLNDVEKNYIAEQSAGVRGINTFKVMMENYGEIQKLANNAIANPNYYKQVQETWANSLEGKKQEFEASKQQLWNNLLDSGAMKGIFDTGSFAVQLTSGIASVIKKAVDFSTSSFVPTEAGKSGVSNFLTAGATGSLLFSSLGFLKNLRGTLKSGEVGGVKNLFEKEFSPLLTLSKGLKTVGSGIFGFGKDVLSGFKGLQEDKDRIKTYRTVVKSGVDEEAIAGTKQALSQQTTTTGRGLAWLAQNSQLVMGTAGIAIAGLAISQIVAQVEKAAQNRTEAIEKAQQKQQESVQADQKLGEFRSFVENNKSQYDEYTQGVNRATNKNISLSESDYQDYLKLTNQIAEYAPDLVSRYDSNGNAILNAKGRDVNALTQALQDNQKAISHQAIGDAKDYGKAYDVSNRQQSWFDASESKYGRIQNRIDLLDWLGTQDLKSLQSWGKGDFSSQGFADKVSKELGEEFTKAIPYLNEISSIKMKDLTADNYSQFMRDVAAAKSENSSELTSLTAPFANTVLPAVAELEKIEKGFQYKNVSDQDWENLTTILSSTSSSKIEELLAQDSTGSEVIKYAENMLEGFKVGGKDFAEAMDAVVNLNSRSSFKDLQFAFERYLPNLGNGFTGGNQNDIIESLGLEEFQKTYQKGNEILAKYAKGEYRDTAIRLKESEDKISDAMSRWNVDDPLTHNTNFEEYTKSNKKLVDSVETLNEKGSSAKEIKEALETKIQASSGADFSKSSFDENIRSVAERFDPNFLDRRLRDQQQDLNNGNKESKGINKNTEEQNELTKETNASLQDFIARNEINTFDEFAELENLLRQTAKERTPDFDLSRLQELWDRSDVSLDQNEERLQMAASRLGDIQKELNAVATAQTNSRSMYGVQEDDFASLVSTFGSLPGFNYDKLFESTYNGVHLNVEEMDRLNNEYKKFNTAKYQKDIDDLTRQWQAQSRKIGEVAEGSAEYNDAIEKRYEIESQIQKAQENLSRFEGMTSPVVEFLNSLSKQEEGAIYDSLASSSGVGVVKDLYSKGLIGTDKFKKFAQMLTKEDLTGKGRDAYLEAYEKGLANFESLFTGDYTGVANGLERLKNAGLINDQEEIIGTIEEISGALSLTNSAAVTFMNKLHEYGIETPFTEENDYMKNLRVSAEEAKESMSDLGKSFQIDTRKTNLEEVQTELDKIAEAQQKISETELYPQKQQDLNNLKSIEDYYKTLVGTLPKAVLDARTEDGKIQANNRLNAFNELNKQKGITQLAEKGFDWDSTNLDYFEAHIQDIGARIKDLSGSTDGILKTNDDGYSETRAILEQLTNQKQLLEEPIIMSYDTSQLKNTDTKNAVEQTQSLVKALDNLQAKQEMAKVGLEIPEKEMNAAKESVQAIWDGIKQIDNGKIAAGLAEKGGFSYDIDFNDDKAVSKLENLLGDEHFLEIVAQLTGDDEVRKKIDEIKNDEYTAKIKDSGYSGGSLNRYMHEAYDSIDESTQKFDYGSLNQKGLSGMETSEVQVVAKFVADQGSLTDVTKPEEKEILLQYIQNSEAFEDLSKEERQVVIDYQLGELPEEQLPVLEQIVNKVLGIDQSQEQPDSLVQDVERVITSDPSETPPEELQQLINRILASDETNITPEQMQQFIDRVIAQDPSLISPITQQQMINRAIGSDPSGIPPAPVTQTVNRVIREIKTTGGTMISEMANGTAHASGTALAEGNAKPSLWQRIKDKGSAFAQGLRGKWGAKKTETAVVGELGPELRVRPKTGRWDMLGGNGAQFAQIHKGDIIFNHKQTEELLENGYVTSNGGRGRLVGTAHVDGTVSGKAYGEGSYHTSSATLKIPGVSYTPQNYTQPAQTTVNNTTVNNNYYQAPTAEVPTAQTPAQTKSQPQQAAQEAKSAKKEAEKFFDWIEVKLDRITRKVDDLGKNAANAFKPYDFRASQYVEEFQTLAEKIDLTNSAISRYQEEAKKIELSSEYIEKIQNGLIDIETITDEDLNDKISKYKQWWDKSLDMQYALTDLQEKLSDIMKSKFELIGSEFDHIIGKIQHAVDLLEGDLGIVEARGHFAGKSYYEDLVGKEMEKLARLQEEHDRMVAQREAYLDTGTILAGSEADLDMINQIYEVETAWKSAYKAMLDYKNDWLEMDRSAFSWVNEQVNNIAEEADFIKEILSVGENDLFVKDIGVLNEKGKTSAAMSAMNFGLYMNQADHYKQKMLEINKALANDPTNTKLIDAKNEYLKLQRESILKANDEKKAIISLIKESYQRMLDNLQKLIDKRKELLNAQKNLYDYERSVRNETDNISSIQKQLLSLENDDSEEAKAKKQTLSNNLKEAKESLYDIEYNQWLTDQQDMLDYLYECTEDFLTQRLDNVDLILQEIIDYSNANSEMINDTLFTQTEALGYTLSDEIQSIWRNEDLQAILTNYYQGFKDMNANVVVSINKVAL